MRPSDEIVKRADMVHGANTELVIGCYLETMGLAEMPQEMLDFGFACFLAGMCEVMTPDSKFNAGYKVETEI